MCIYQGKNNLVLSSCQDDDTILEELTKDSERSRDGRRADFVGSRWRPRASPVQRGRREASDHSPFLSLWCLFSTTTAISLAVYRIGINGVPRICRDWGEYSCPYQIGPIGVNHMAWPTGVSPHAAATWQVLLVDAARLGRYYFPVLVEAGGKQI